MTDSCGRWVALADRNAQGETLSEQERQWQRTHAERCPACTAETRFWSQVEGILSHPEYLESPIDTLPPHRTWPRHPRVWAMACAAVLALGAGLYGVKHSKLPFTASTAAPRASAPATSRLVAVSGAVALGAQTAKAGSILNPNDELTTQAGRACVSTASSIVTCLDEHSRASVLATKSGGTVVRLAQGKVLSRLARQPQDKPFAIHTPLGTVTAKGTVFSVELREQPGKPQVAIHLYEGQLTLETADRRTSQLAAPASAILGESITSQALSQADSAKDQPLLTLSEYLRQARAPNAQLHLSLSTEPASARITLDGVPLGDTPLSALVPRGDHLGVELTGYAPVAEVLPSPNGQIVERHFRLTKLEPAMEASASLPTVPVAPTGSAGPSATVMLAQARKLRAQGKFEACANAYRRLISAYPGSNEAHVTRVSLGELSLRQLGQPEAAQRAFDQYLQRGGPLTREARYGKIQALEQLGRAAEAEALARVFLRQHPQSVQAETLRRKYESR